MLSAACTGLCWHSVCNRHLVLSAACTGMAMSCDQMDYSKRSFISGNTTDGIPHGDGTCEVCAITLMDEWDILYWGRHGHMMPCGCECGVWGCWDEHPTAGMFYSGNSVFYCVWCVVVLFVMDGNLLTIQKYLMSVVLSLLRNLHTQMKMLLKNACTCIHHEHQNTKKRKSRLLILL
jgi:hypothetical protein